MSSCSHCAASSSSSSSISPLLLPPDPHASRVATLPPSVLLQRTAAFHSLLSPPSLTTTSSTAPTSPSPTLRLCLTCSSLFLPALEAEFEALHHDDTLLHAALARPPLAPEEAPIRETEEAMAATFIQAHGIANQVHEKRLQLQRDVEMLLREEQECLQQLAASSELDTSLQEARQLLSLARDQERNVAAVLSRYNHADLFDIHLSSLDTKVLPTICALRLGKLSAASPPWVETNAALGQVVLLLRTVVQSVTARYEGTVRWMTPVISAVQLVYRGSSSYLRVNNHHDLPLYYTEEKLGWMLPTFIKASPFRNAMLALLKFVGGLRDFARTERPPPVADVDSRDIWIDGSVIGNGAGAAYDVRYEDTSYSNWTEALRLLLALCRQLAEWSGSLSVVRE